MLLLLLMTACEHEVLSSGHPDEGETSDDKVRIEIFARANDYKLPSTKGTDNENKVGKTPWILVFKGNGENATFIEAVQAFELVGKRFVILTKQPAGNKYQLLILANPQSRFYYGDNVTGYDFNADNLLTRINPGITTLSEVCKNLRTEPLDSPSLTTIPYNGADEPIPMSYLLEVDKIDNTTKIENSDKSSLQLIRSVAKLMIINNASNFKLKGIMTVVNVPRQGQWHNLDGSIMDNTSNLTEYQYDAAYSSPLVTTEVVTGGQSTENNPIYLYESDKRNEPYIIIQGSYENQDYYYKMAIVDDTLQSMNILRNRAYKFTIKTVKGPGYDSVEDAKISKASNTALDFTILVDDSNSYEIIANNDYYLAVSNSVFIAYSNNSTTHEAFNVITDCKKDFPDARSITDNEMDVEEGSFHLSYPEDGKIPIVENNISPRITPIGVFVSNRLQWHEEGLIAIDGTKRINASVTLKLGNLEKQIHIRQRNAISTKGDTLRFMPTSNLDPLKPEINYYSLSAYVEDGNDNPRSWIKLRSSIPDSDRNDTEHITVDDGIIYIEVLPNYGSERNGIVYLTTIGNPGSSKNGSSVKRIKIDITQSGRVNN